MKIVVTLIAVGAFGAGLMSAWFWFRSAKREAPQASSIASFISPNGQTPMDAWAKVVAEDNRKAAGWSALAVVLGSAATLLGTWAG